ncbi:MAG TPA: hypothetical protein VFZ75_05520 [Actinomycetota bacterium]|nr:hypothetical protein [Actinomycetota bacterium]
MTDPTGSGAPSTGDRHAGSADGSWMLWTAVGIIGIWVAVVLISVFSPDFVSGSEQEHLPLAAFTTWFWGGVGTLIFLWAMGKLRGSAAWRPTWIGLAVVTLVVWGAAAIVGIAAPVFETGSDPTQIPFGAFLAPVAAAMLTALAGVVANVFRRGDPNPDRLGASQNGMNGS